MSKLVTITKLNKIDDIVKVVPNINPASLQSLSDNVLDDIITFKSFKFLDDPNLTKLDLDNLTGQLKKIQKQNIQFNFLDLSNLSKNQIRKIAMESIDISSFKNIDDLFKAFPDLKPIGTISKSTPQQQIKLTVDNVSAAANVNPTQVNNNLRAAVNNEPLPANNLANPAEKSSFTQKVKQQSFKTKDEVLAWTKANKVTAAMTLLASTMAIIAIVRNGYINSTEFKIISISQDNSDQNYLEIKYNNDIKFTSGVSVNILSSNSIPSINGNYSIYKPESGKFFIKGPKLQSNGDFGTFTVSTSFAVELGDSVNKYVKDPTTEFTKTITKNYLDSITEFFSQYWWVFLILLILLFILSSFFVAIK